MQNCQCCCCSTAGPPYPAGTFQLVSGIPLTPMVPAAPVADVASTAALTDLITSYNSLLASLRSAGLLRTV